MNLNSFYITNIQQISPNKNNLNFLRRIGNVAISANFNFKINKINNISFIFFGNVNGYFKDKKFYQSTDIRIILRKLNFKDKIIDEKVELIDGNFVIIEIKKNNNLQISIDKFAKNDLFYYSDHDKFSISNNFKLLVKSLKKKQ